MQRWELAMRRRRIVARHGQGGVRMSCGEGGQDDRGDVVNGDACALYTLRLVIYDPYYPRIVAVPRTG